MTKEAPMMPQVPFGPHTISRLIVGGNQQVGAAHQPGALGAHMREYFTTEQTIEFVRDCIAQGINAWQGNYSEKTRDVLQKLREDGEVINLIPLSTSPAAALGEEPMQSRLERMASGWDDLLAVKPIGVFLWGMMTDRLWRAGKIDLALDFLAKVRDAGVQVGVATHIPEVIEYIDEKGWDVDFYMASVYKWQKTREEILAILPEVPHDGFGGAELFLPSELPKMCDTIRKTPKTCLAFKIFAGGRTCSTPEQVSEVFEYVLGHIKPTDAVVVGMYPRFAEQMIQENADLVKKFGEVPATPQPA